MVTKKKTTKKKSSRKKTKEAEGIPSGGDPSAKEPEKPEKRPLAVGFWIADQDFQNLQSTLNMMHEHLSGCGHKAMATYLKNQMNAINARPSLQ